MVEILQGGFHGGEINGMAKIASGWLVSGGDDGTLRISRITNNHWATPVVEHSHLSSVRAVHVCYCPMLGQHIICSAGGRAQIKIWRANLGFQRMCFTSFIIFITTSFMNFQAILIY